MSDLSKLIKSRREELAEIGEGGVDLLHLRTGYEIIVERTGSARDDTEYTISIGSVPKPITNDMAELASWLEALPDNTKPREYKSEGEVKTMLGAVQASGGDRQLGEGGSRGGGYGGGRRSIEADATGEEDEYGDESGEAPDDDIPY